MEEKVNKVSMTERFLGSIERACNKLPSPVMLFMYLFIIIAVISWIASLCGLALTNPATGKVVTVRNFFSQEGLNWLLTSFVKNFSGFASLGLVLTMTVGINLCEQVGLVDALLRKSTGGVNGTILPYVIALIGTCGNLASDTCSVLVPPLGALAFMGAGRSPIVGMFCGWLSANLGFSANLFIAGTDSLLAGITNTSIKVLLGPEAKFEVDSACNWYFMFASTWLITLVVGWCTNHLIEKRVGPYHGEMLVDTAKPLTDLERKGLRKAGVALLVYVAIIVVGIYTGPLANPKTGGVIGSLFLKGLIPLILFMFLICGIVYGRTVGAIKSERDVSKIFTKAMGSMASFIAFCFTAGQFTALFGWTNLGVLLAIAGADFLKAVNFTGVPMFIGIIILVIFINLFMTSGSAKWTFLGPVLVPMLMLMNYHPAWIQLLYRIGDSPTNALSPVSPYLYMCLALVNEKYDKDMKLGTFIANCIPTIFIAQVAWIILAVVWFFAGWPVGPGAPLHLPTGILP
ncbi:MAG: AbgT family transporter [Pyramidobacter sp.]|jgi:aminobenzoyl-glutamate transport protein|nr:AbgT family transporter [Pyramidobacter sp.]MBP3752167.1 AbgT family transporter [Pyramidobacter sp.]MBQ4490485.1 AbgT family transporter [Pyramidobacter sp.]MBQ8091357.1 AbgT family transporter [Pyramidobacter sp.]